MSRARNAAPDGRYGPVRSLLYLLIWLVVGNLLRLYLRVRVRGRPRPFPRGPLVVAANHCSYLDPLVLALTVPRRVVYLVTSNVYFQPFYRPWMWLFGCIPVHDDSVNVGAVRAALAALQRGQVVGIFPEGGISDDGRLKEGRIGVASLLLLGDVPVLTVAITGTHEAMPRDAKLPRPARVEVVYSDVVTPSEVDASLDPRARRRLLRDRVMTAIARALPERMQPAPREADATAEREPPPRQAGV